MTLAIGKDRLVTLAVKMADMTGKVIEESPEEGLTYLHGHGDIFPKIEAALEGRFPGEGFTIALEPHDAFGEYDSDAIKLVPLERLGEPETVVPGLVFETVPGEAPDGKLWRVVEIAEGFAVMEANHPLAGLGLQFEVRVLKVEEPEGDATGTDEVVVPGFLAMADRLVNEDEDELTDEEMDAELARAMAGDAKPEDSPMAKLARAPRIIR